MMATRILQLPEKNLPNLYNFELYMSCDHSLFKCSTFTTIVDADVLLVSLLPTALLRGSWQLLRIYGNKSNPRLKAATEFAS